MNLNIFPKRKDLTEKVEENAKTQAISNIIAQIHAHTLNIPEGSLKKNKESIKKYLSKFDSETLLTNTSNLIRQALGDLKLPPSAPITEIEHYEAIESEAIASKNTMHEADKISKDASEAFLLIKKESESREDGIKNTRLVMANLVRNIKKINEVKFITMQKLYYIHGDDTEKSKIIDQYDQALELLNTKLKEVEFVQKEVIQEWDQLRALTDETISLTSQVKKLPLQTKSLSNNTQNKQNDEADTDNSDSDSNITKKSDNQQTQNSGKNTSASQPPSSVNNISTTASTVNDLKLEGSAVNIPFPEQSPIPAIKPKTGAQDTSKVENSPQRTEEPITSKETPHNAPQNIIPLPKQIIQNKRRRNAERRNFQTPTLPQPDEKVDIPPSSPSPDAESAKIDTLKDSQDQEENKESIRQQVKDFISQQITEKVDFHDEFIKYTDDCNDKKLTRNQFEEAFSSINQKIQTTITNVKNYEQKIFIFCEKHELNVEELENIIAPFSEYKNQLEELKNDFENQADIYRQEIKEKAVSQSQDPNT